MKCIYVCGPTVHSQAHIGNLRPIITFDIYARILKALNQEVDLTHNITDIDDKIIATAMRTNSSEVVVAGRYLSHYNKLLQACNVHSINHQPLVTNNIDIIINFIQMLLAKGMAYEVQGNVFFHVAKAKYYGHVSHQNPSKLVMRDTHHFKANPLDFALWKQTDAGIRFQAPWGVGRPGWHTECAALINDIYRGKPLDIHSGGVDLIFPHHENEDAQFWALHGRPITSEWKHVGQINVKSIKMSKSLGNIIDASAFIKTYGADTLKMIFISSHVTRPININKNLIANAKHNVMRIKKAYIRAQLMGGHSKKDQAALKLILHWKFSEFNKLVIKKIKSFNNNNSLVLAGEIIFLAKVLGFNFAKLTVSLGDKKLYHNWQKHQAEKNYEQADAFRTILSQKELI